MRDYPNTLKRNLLNTIFQMQEDLPQYERSTVKFHTEPETAI